jgi:hypothetical protein
MAKIPVAVTPRLLEGKVADIANGFTIGKRYAIIKMDGNNAVVLNDNGHERSVGLDGGKSAHIKRRHQWGSDMSPYYTEECVGYFEIVFQEEEPVKALTPLQEIESQARTDARCQHQRYLVLRRQFSGDIDQVEECLNDFGFDVACKYNETHDHCTITGSAKLCGQDVQVGATVTMNRALRQILWFIGRSDGLKSVSSPEQITDILKADFRRAAELFAKQEIEAEEVKAGCMSC